jgi:hypothetical protein
MARKLRIEPYDPDAIDADNDGIVQEGTAWERPVGSRLLDEIGNDIQRGITSLSRPSMRVVGSDGADIAYKPSYGSAGAAKKRGKPSQLGSIGYPTLSERGFLLGSSSLEEIGYPGLDAQVPTVEQIINPPNSIDVNAGAVTSGLSSVAEDFSEPEVPAEDFEDAFSALARGLPQDQRVPIRINRNRAFKRADEKAQELAFTSGDHYVVETDKEILVLSKRDYDDFINRIGGSGNVPDGVEVMRYGKPKAQFAGAEEAKAELIGPTRVSTIDDEKYRNAVADIHYGSGDVADLDDDIFVAAIFDENLVVDETSGLSILNPQGVDMTFEDIMTGNFDDSVIFSDIAAKATFENKRFKFKTLKGNQGRDSMGGHEYGGLWTVFRVEDKETGEVWYLKASTFGSNDGILENIGMEASAVLDLAARNDPKEIRTGTQVPVVDPRNPDWNDPMGRKVRWTAMRSIESWDRTADLKIQTEDGKPSYWVDSGRVGGVDPDKVNPQDVAQVLALDYIFDNLDRHENNIKVAYDEDGNQRLGVIDNGLMFGGRAPELMSIGHDVEVEGYEFEEHAESRKDMTPTNYAASGGNIFFNYLGTFGTRISSDPEAMRQFTEGQKIAIKKFRAQIDEILSLDRLRSRGIELTPTEEAHINAMRTLAMTRLKYLEDNPTALIQAIKDTTSISWNGGL